MDREEILRRFEVWLDGVLAAEEPPQGLAAELLASLGGEFEPGADAGREADSDHECDLYSLWAAVTALTQEIKLEGRSFKQLSETLSPLSDLAARWPEMERDAQQRIRKEMLDVLLDLRDRLGRGLEAASVGQARMSESLRAGWIAHWRVRRAGLRLASESVAALEQGYRLSLARLDEVLAQLDVQELDCQGQLFDPGSMHAVDVEETDRADDGTVVEVYRAGYEWNGEIYRPAQVRVARRRPGGISPGGSEDE